MTSCTSTPGSRTATSTLMTSSSRGGDGQVGRRAQPAGQLLGAVGGDPEPLLRAGIGVVVGLDQAVALQPLQRRVHLPDVERPHLAGARLELLAQLQAVLRALAQQRQQRMPDAHDVTALDIMLGSILSIISLRQPSRLPLPVRRRRRVRRVANRSRRQQVLPLGARQYMLTPWQQTSNFRCGRRARIPISGCARSRRCGCSLSNSRLFRWTTRAPPAGHGRRSLAASACRSKRCTASTAAVREVADDPYLGAGDPTARHRCAGRSAPPRARVPWQQALPLEAAGTRSRRGRCCAGAASPTTAVQCELVRLRTSRWPLAGRGGARRHRHRSRRCPIWGRGHLRRRRSRPTARPHHTVAAAADRPNHALRPPAADAAGDGVPGTRRARGDRSRTRPHRCRGPRAGVDGDHRRSLAAGGRRCRSRCGSRPGRPAPGLARRLRRGCTRSASSSDRAGAALCRRLTVLFLVVGVGLPIVGTDLPGGWVTTASKGIG